MIEVIKAIVGILGLILAILCYSSGGWWIVLGIISNIIALIAFDFDPSNTTTWIFWDF